MIKKSYKQLGIDKDQLTQFQNLIYGLGVARWLNPTELWVAGGCLLRLVDGTPLETSDIDFWVASEDILQDVGHNFENHSMIRENEDQPPIEYVGESPEGFSLAEYMTQEGHSIDLIYNPKMHYLAQTAEAFDLEHCKIAWAGGDNFFVGKDTLECIQKKRQQVSFKTPLTPAAKAKLLNRVIKYATRGYTDISPSVVEAITDFQPSNAHHLDIDFSGIFEEDYNGVSAHNPFQATINMKPTLKDIVP